MSSKEERLEKLKELCDLFRTNIKQYKSSKYDEANTRADFIDKFFKLLDWDVHNDQGFNETYREVVREDKVIIEGKPKAPDYSFRIGKERKFFLEAKKPSINIKEEIEPAFQVRRYGYTAKLALCILTDFEELSVYDTRIKPEKNDKASVARIFYCTFEEYEKHFDFIYNTFSKTAILRGSFDTYIQENKNKKGTSEVDKDFLNLIEGWREALAKNIALRNKELDIFALNHSVQVILDRIIFLRIAEDKNMERYGLLGEIAKKENVYKNLDKIFLKANDKYNSGLFRPEKWVSDLYIDDKIINNIIKYLYYPDCPYELSVLPIEILGNIYEQFLGKTIRLTSSHQAKVEEKEEVRKAGGVYYTPQYIVNYIVENTVGEKLKDIDLYTHPKLTILDPACGSGSFLVGAYSFLLDKYFEAYTDKKRIEKCLKNGLLYQISENSYRLSITVKQSILLNHIFGVDIDYQAVEVTKLSLLLKLMEDENTESADRLFKYSDVKLLPDLSDNIKCGNSLISSDFYEDKELELFGKEEIRKTNTFDWEKQFPKIFKDKGFDCIIGNPPYGFHQIHSDFAKQYFKKNLVSSGGSFEHYFLFFERSLKLLNPKGVHGFIVPVTWLTIPSALSLRKFIIDNFALSLICWLPELVFEKAKVNTLIAITRAEKIKQKEKILIHIYDSLGFVKPPIRSNFLDPKNLKESNYSINIFDDKDDTKIIKKIESNSKPLEEFARPCSGYNPYEVGKGEAENGGLQTKDTVVNKPYHSEKKIGKDWKPEIIGRDLSRYNVTVSGKRWIKYGPWLAAPRDPNNFKGPRILVQEITGGKERRIVAAYYEDELYHSRDVIPVKCESKNISPLFLLGIINSSLITWYHHKRNPKAQKGLFPKVLVSDLSKLPIYNIDLSSKKKPLYEKIISTVEQMIATKNQALNSKNDLEKETYQKKCELLDKQIDKCVFELYDLNDEEMRIKESLT
jgi:adenine-specific DNA-methyltransferase